jgi:hypothetical protein
MIANAAMLPFSDEKKAPDQLLTELNARASAKAEHSAGSEQCRMDNRAEQCD